MSAREDGTDENRRALLSHYRSRSVVYASLALVLAIAFAVELGLLSWSAFPQFLVYPVLFATAAPALFLLYSSTVWWRTAGYVVSVPIQPVEGDSLVKLNQRYRNLVHEGVPFFLLPGGRRLNAQLIAVGILIVFLLSIPISYYESTLHAGVLNGTIAASLYLGGVALVVVAFYLISRAQRVVRVIRIDDLVAALRDQADQFRLASSRVGIKQVIYSDYPNNPLCARDEVEGDHKGLFG